MNSSSLPAVERLDVQAFINAQPLSPYQWRIVLLCFLIVFLDGLDTAAMGFIAPALTQDWGIDRASLGPVMSAALIGMVFGALGSGPLADRYGRKLVLVAAVFLFGLFSLASAYSTNVEQLLALRFLTGLGLGAAMPNATTPAFRIHPRAPQVAAGDQHVLWLQPGHGLRRISSRRS